MINDKLKLRGSWYIEHILNGKVIRRIKVPNDIVDQGLNDLLDNHFNAGVQITPWHIGLIDNAGFVSLANSDTHAAHGGWSENTDYTEGARVPWGNDAPAARAITNTTPADFSMNAVASIIGIFIAEESIKGSSSATILWSTALFGSILNVVNGSTLRVTYTLDG